MGVILSLFHTVRNRNRSSQPPPAPAVPETHELDTLHASPTSAPPTATIPRPRLPPRVFAALSSRSRATAPASPAGVPAQAQALPAARAAPRQQKRGMADDASYLSFLEKANAPLGGSNEAQASGSGKKGFKTVDEGAKVPEVIRKAIEGVVYVSDADEGFEGVSLGTGGRGMVDGESFADLIGSPDGREIEILDISQWDERGEYKSIVDAIRDATSGGDVRVYRVPRGATRVEYWVVGVEEGEEGRLVGAKALSVES
ncbi:hypothetical protein VE01_06304 [Pseudogymnoascus verrucosus]|uniref:Uncharacterized protein n=1 Tax=Pseudogymnoascus verrucosus TaxID=342668 RepID=A0A1B8GG57_9PEZI|nr:uncharacterized protein VE01_06304 [Pseudogymnoascus verrucosus]OBT94812.1 hypothetical protein VE01_06304 [Pseudogymnoascus verrucosus]